MPIRGLLSEYGIVIGKGINQVRKNLPEILEDGENGLTASGRELFAERYDQLKELDRQIGEQDRRMERLAQQNELSRRLIEIPGIGPVTATAVAADIGEGKPYRNGRDYAASWQGSFRDNTVVAASRSYWGSASEATGIYGRC